MTKLSTENCATERFLKRGKEQENDLKAIHDAGQGNLRSNYYLLHITVCIMIKIL